MSFSNDELYKKGREYLFNGLKDKTIERNTSKYATIIANLIYLRGQNSTIKYNNTSKIIDSIELKIGTVKILIGSFFNIINILDNDNSLLKYKGNENQIKLANDLGISHLGQLYICLSVLGYIEVLGYTQVNLPRKKFSLMIETLSKEGLIEKYKGNENQVLLANYLGISHLGQLYSGLSVLGYINELGYKQVNLPKAKLELIVETLSKDGGIEKYKGNENQVLLANDLGISHLGHLYNGLLILGYVDKLGYKLVNLSKTKLNLIVETLSKDGGIEKYKGNENQVLLANDLGIKNLGHLYLGLSALGYIDKLEYSRIYLTLSQIYKNLELFNKIVRLKEITQIYIRKVYLRACNNQKIYIEIIDNINIFLKGGFKGDFSRFRLIKYILNNLNNNNFTNFNKVILSPENEIAEIQNMISIGTEIEFNELIKILLRTTGKNYDEYIKSQDVLNKVDNLDLAGHGSGNSELDLIDDYDDTSIKLKEILESNLPEDILVNIYGNGSENNINYAVKWIKDNKPELLDLLFEFIN